MALCYNFTRVLNILGLDRFMAYLAQRRSNWAILLLNAVVVAVGRLQNGSRVSQSKFERNAAAIRPAFNCAL